MQITRKTWNNYIKLLRNINDKAADELERWISKNFASSMISTDYRDSDGNNVIDMAFAISQQYGDAAAAVSAQMYDAIAEASGHLVPPAEMAANPSYGEVAKTVQGVLKTSQNAREVSGAVSRLVKRTGADTTLRNAARDGAQFAWVPSGDTCPFCLMLASNGWQYMSKKALKNGHAEHIHSNCDCTYAIRFDQNTQVAGYDPDVYRDMYYSADGNTPKERLNSMRRAQYAKDKDVINEQKRTAYAERVLRTTRSDNIINYAKAEDIFSNPGVRAERYTAQDIADDLETSQVGRDTIRWIDESKVVPKLYADELAEARRGEQVGRDVRIYLRYNKDAKEAAQAVIHEMVHYRYHIGGCQHAEAICLAYEKMHAVNRTYLTEPEWLSVVETIKKRYPEYEWERGGYGVFEQFNFVRKPSL